MTIELREKKPKLPLLWTNGAILPMYCHSELGILYVHSNERFMPSEAVLGLHDMSYVNMLKHFSFRYAKNV